MQKRNADPANVSRAQMIPFADIEVTAFKSLIHFGKLACSENLPGPPNLGAGFSVAGVYARRRAIPSKLGSLMSILIIHGLLVLDSHACCRMGRQAGY
jgi:hypothetical protein